MGSYDVLIKQARQLQAALSEPPAISISCYYGEEDIPYNPDALIIKTTWTVGPLEEVSDGEH